MCSHNCKFRIIATKSLHESDCAEPESLAQKIILSQATNFYDSF